MVIIERPFAYFYHELPNVLDIHQVPVALGPDTFVPSNNNSTNEKQQTS
jgi:hypothetical protein